MSDPRDPARRRALVVLGTATGCALGAVAVPAIAFVAQPGEGAAGPARFCELDLGVGDLEPGRPRRVRVDGELPAVVWLIRDGAQGGAPVRALSARCPHLGCSVGLAEDQRGFACPCHHARFALDGTRLEQRKNPAPRDLDPLEVRIEPRSSRIQVRVVHYQPGVASRVVIG